MRVEVRCVRDGRLHGMQYLFYDLETSGFNPKWQRIMQFAARRVDENLKPIGEPTEHLITVTDEILPDPNAVLLTGITPQQTRRDGLSEADFWQEVYPILTTPNTCIVGYNNIRFDDEFIRYSLWRNLRDPYSWGYSNGNSRWDLLDVARMARALRPDGLDWPDDEHGKPRDFRLESLVEANGIQHGALHSALVDVDATIELARLMRKAQPKLWAWLHSLRTKQAAELFIEEQGGEPFVYTSGSYPMDQFHTTLVSVVGKSQRGVWVYDLRVSPGEWLERTDQEIEQAMEERERLPIKQIMPNRVPAMAPLATLDERSRDRLEIDMSQIEKNRQMLKKYKLTDFLRKLGSLQDKRWAGKPKPGDVDGELYDGFVSDTDRRGLDRVVADPLVDLPDFQDSRLSELVFRYRARNIQKLLSTEELAKWETYRQQRLTADYGMSLEKFYQKMQELSVDETITDQQKELLTELDLYAQSIAPVDDQ